MQIIVNKKTIIINSDQENKTLLHFLREDLDLTGAKNGCGIGVCGTCTVLVDSVPVKACKKLVKDVVGKEILTIEGMTQPDGSLHPLQQAFIDAGAIQCGFCTPGMVLTAHAFLLKNSKPTREEIRKAIAGNLCRCTGYQQIVDAIEIASDFYQYNYEKHLLSVTTAIEKYEQQYHLTSQEFYRKFNDGSMGDKTDFIEWASLVEIQKNIIKNKGLGAN